MKCKNCNISAIQRNNKTGICQRNKKCREEYFKEHCGKHRMLGTYTVYTLTNKVNGKKYVGRTSKPMYARISAHKQKATKVKLEQGGLCEAIRKYGMDAFILFIEEMGLKLNQANSAEQWYIKHYKTTDKKHGYNLESGGTTGKRLALETRAKISIAAMGNKNGLGNKHTEEYKERSSVTQSIIHGANGWCKCPHHSSARQRQP